MRKSKYIKDGYAPMMTYDSAFSAIYHDKIVLSILLHGVLGLDKKYVQENVIYSDSKLPISHLNEKQKQSDLVVRFDKKLIIIEMNKNFWNGVYERNVNYIEKISGSYVNINHNYIDKPVTILINIDQFFESIDNVKLKYTDDLKVVKKYIIVDEETKEPYKYDKRMYIHIDLQVVVAKFKTLTYNELNEFEKSLMMLLGISYKTLNDISKESEELKLMGDKIKDLVQEEEFIGLYDKEVEQEYIMNRMYIDGVEEGIEKGIEKGIKEGKLQERKQIALNLINDGISLKSISKNTGLSIQDLNDLKHNN